MPRCRKSKSGVADAALMTIVAGSAALAWLKSRKKKKQKQRRRYGVHPSISDRATAGAFVRVYKNLRRFPDRFSELYRLTPDQFDFILAKMNGYMEKQTLGREPICPEERLAVTLEFLAQGPTMKHLAKHYKIGHATAWKIINETTRIISTVLEEEYVTCPREANEWKAVAVKFENRWNFPHCLGAIDGKHIQLACPINSGSQYFNYKQTYSIVLMAVCDANYCFTYYDVGAFGRNNDAGILASSDFGQKLNNGSLNLPSSEKLQKHERGPEVPYYFIGDEGFPLKTSLLRPFSQAESIKCKNKRIFNYRLSRARRLIENCFGILAHRWRIFLRPVECQPHNVTFFVKAAISLHNYLRKSAPDSNYCPASLLDREGEGAEGQKRGQWRKDRGTGLKEIGRVSSNFHTKKAKDLRDLLTEYFVHCDALDWQSELAD